MRKFILFIGVFCFLVRSAAQDSTINHPRPLTMYGPVHAKPAKDSRDFYFAKSKKTKTAAIILLSGGIVIGGIGWYSYEQSLNQEYTLNQLGDAIVNTAGGEFAMIVGSAMVITSIPLFIASGHFRRKAMSMSAALKMEPYQSISQTALLSKRYPAIGLVIHL